MLKRIVLALAIFVVALALIDRFSLLVAPCGPGGGGYSDQKSANDDNCATREGIIVSGIEWLREQPPEFWTAIASFTIAIFTGTLWFSTDRLWRASQAQLRLANDEFASTHRPRIIMRQFQVDPILPDHPIRITFSVINIGNTDAILRLIGTEVALWDIDRRIYEAPGIDPMTRPITEERIRILPNGRRVAFTAESRFAVTEAQSDAIGQGRFLLRCIGELTYADTRGTDRRTGFHRTYDVETDLFTPSDNPDQEYCD